MTADQARRNFRHPQAPLGQHGEGGAGEWHGALAISHSTERIYEPSSGLGPAFPVADPDRPPSKLVAIRPARFASIGAYSLLLIEPGCGDVEAIWSRHPVVSVSQ